MTHQQSYISPVGDLIIKADDFAITEIKFGTSPIENKSPLTERAVAQLDEYFRSERNDFDLPLMPKGTEFQRAVWAELVKIPISKTFSYGQLAELVGKPKAARAIGGAVGANPIAIVIPCHRVLASDGKITGYTGGDGIKTKRSLLDLEGALVESSS